MADETLLYRFEETGLDDLRKDMKKLASDIEDVGDEATQAGAEMKGAFESAEESVEDLDDRAIDFDVRAALASLQRVSGALDDIERKLDRLDGRTIDIDSDVDRAPVGGAGGAGDGGGGRRRGGVASNLPGELDEAARVVSVIPNKALALIGALGAAAAALGAAGGLAAAATALARKFGSVDIQEDIGRLKQRFRQLGATFAQEFEPIIRSDIIPAGVALARSLRSVIPDLKTFTENNLPNLVSAVRGLVQATVGLAQIFGLVARTFGLLVSSGQLFSALLGGQPDFTGENEGFLRPGVRKELVDILQGLGLGGETIGGGRLSFQVPQTQASQIAQSIQSGEQGILADQPIPATEDLRKVQTEIDKLERKFFELGTITEKEFLQNLLQLRRKGVDALTALEVEIGKDLKRTEEWARAVKETKKRLEGLGSSELESLQRPSDVTVQEVGDPTLIEQEMPELDTDLTLFQGLREQIDRINNKPFIPAAKKTAQKVSAITGRIKELQSQGALMSEPAMQRFLESLGISDELMNKILTKMQGVKKEARSAGDTIKASLQQSLARAGDQAFRAFGQSVAQGLFGGGGGPGVAGQRLRLFNAKKQMRSLRQALRQGQISYKAFSLRVKAQQRRIQKQQERLNETMKSGFEAFADNLGDSMIRILQQLAAEIVAVTAKMAVLKLLIDGLKLGTGGGFFGSVLGQIGGAAFQSKASGGAKVAAPTPKMRSGSLKLNVVGQLVGDGRSIKATLDTEANAQSQFGRR